ncbi:Calx-beta domain-containing protein [Tundrisphaera lichenicola]|uniref:Calx-beta domain-containing protein n=1 Tax=Tundrisphaera lichenicola TaxID=2029860 RepID=UPI003EBD7605
MVNLSGVPAGTYYAAIVPAVAGRGIAKYSLSINPPTTAKPGAFQLSSSSYTVNESAGIATITVNRTGGDDGTVSVKYATSDGSANAGSDYITTSGTLYFSNGETTKTFIILILGDSSAELTETVNLTLSTPTGGATIGTTPTATLIIFDDDSTQQPLPIVDNDGGSPGYVEAGTGWATSGVAGGYGGSTRYHAAGTSAQTAMWTATALTPGSYDVQVTWGAATNRATNAPYRIYDGNTLLATVRVNQSLAPTGTTVGGQTFQSLGSFAITGSTLRVVLGADANGLVSADAIRIVSSSGSRSVARSLAIQGPPSPIPGVSAESTSTVPLATAKLKPTILGPGIGSGTRAWSSLIQGDSKKFSGIYMPISPSTVPNSIRDLNPRVKPSDRASVPALEGSLPG